jgi:SAM-dependent methyltransferase
MRIHKKILFMLLVFAGIGLDFAKEQTDVLTPENANEARLNRLQPPDRVMDVIGVRPGMTVAEIGAGRGRYTVQLAVRVGRSGKVYAEDIAADALAYMRQRCRRWGLENVEVVQGDANDPKLPAGQLDMIWIVSSYHHFDDPVRLAIGEWISINEIGRHGTTSENIIKQMKTAGYAFERIDKFLKANNFLIYLFHIDGSQ